MKKIINKLKDGAIMGVGFLLILGAVHAWNGLQADPGDTLTSDKWNELVTKVETLETNVGSGSLGVGQTRNNVTSERSIGNTYTNNSGLPIEVAFSAQGSSTSYTYIYIDIDGERLMNHYESASPGSGYVGPTITFIVPNGSTYRITGSSLEGIGSWRELR